MTLQCFPTPSPQLFFLTSDRDRQLREYLWSGGIHRHHRLELETQRQQQQLDNIIGVGAGADEGTPLEIRRWCKVGEVLDLVGDP